MPNVKIHGFRYQLIGDVISAIPQLYYYEKKYPGSFKSWGLARKVSQMAPLLLNHPLINQIFIFDGEEGPQSKRDFDFINSHDIILNGNPSHLDNRYPQEFTIYSESWRMGGLDIKDWNKLTEEERRPKLEKWFKPESRPINSGKIVSLWGFASYGNREQKRNPTKKWYEELVSKLINQNIHVVQFGHPNDPVLFDNWDWSEGSPQSFYYHRLNHLDFFTQIKTTLSTDCMLGTDSGSSLIMAAYNFRQVTLLTDHWGNANNPYSLAPDNPNNFNFFAPGGCVNISIDKVVGKVLELVK
jgi:hypothetical protein